MYQQLSIGKALYTVFCQHHFVKAVHVTVDGKTLLYGPGKEMDSRPESWPCHMQTMRIGVLGFSVPQVFFIYNVGITIPTLGGCYKDF